MGKKKRPVNYDRKALTNLSRQIKLGRRPLKEGNIPELKIDLEGLENTIKSLPKNQREVTEKFWGLIPGTMDHSKQLGTRKRNDIAYQNMLNATLGVMRDLIHFEYLRLYDANMKEIFDGLVSKVDKTGAEEVSDEDAIKYFLIFLIFIANGPRLLVEEEGYQINLKEEQESYFDEYALLRATWKETAKHLPDHSIKLKLLMETISMFDLKQVVAMKHFARLPVETEFDNPNAKPVQTFAEIRLLKEELFPYGAWDVTTLLIYGAAKEEDRIDVSDLAEHFHEFRKNWDEIKKYKVSETTLVTTKGETKLDRYRIGCLEFTDIYEVMFLYVSRSLL